MRRRAAVSQRKTDEQAAVAPRQSLRDAAAAEIAYTRVADGMTRQDRLVVPSLACESVKFVDASTSASFQLGVTTRASPTASESRAPG